MSCLQHWKQKWMLLGRYREFPVILGGQVMSSVSGVYGKSKSLNVLWLERWIFLANSFFSNIWRSGIWPQDAPGHEVMPVPKGHGYVFAVEAKHCRGVRATQRTPTWRGLGIAMWTWSIFLGTVSKEYLGYEREGQLAKMKSKIRQMGQICWLSYLRV